MSPEDVSPIGRERNVAQLDSIVDGKKDGVSGVVEELDVEEGEAHKTFYSKGSVIMMVIFSGLAIGSDG
jgi:putative component of toxin-antitoxin plasmid stabilization module